VTFPSLLLLPLLFILLFPLTLAVSTGSWFLAMFIWGGNNGTTAKETAIATGMIYKNSPVR
jgi:hypothetical protein